MKNASFLDIRKVFIISSGRTGTRFLGERFGALLPDAISVHEPDKVKLSEPRLLREKIRRQSLWELFVLKGLGILGSRNISLQSLAGKISPDQVKRKILRERRWVSEVDLYVEANSQLFGVAEILTSLPHTRVIFLVRDPRDWVRSWMNRGAWYDEKDLMSRLDFAGFKRLSPRHVEGSPADRVAWQGFSRFEKLCWAWSFMNRHFWDTWQRGLENVSLFRFEDVFVDRTPEACSGFLAEIAGEKADEALGERFRIALEGIVNPSADAGFAPWQEWSPGQRLRFDELCGALMREMEYGGEPEWKDGLRRAREQRECVA